MIGMKLNYRYWTKSKGIKGKLEREEDFLVTELIDQKFLKRFKRTANGINQMQGRYFIFLLKKKGLTTEAAIERLSRRFKMPKEEFGYAGLKDKFSVSYQYMTVKRIIKPVKTKDLEVSRIRRIDRPIHTGDLLGNEFLITLHFCKSSGISKIVKELEKRSMPNYFGLQRFGKNKNNHVIGRLLVKRNFSKALQLLNTNYKGRYNSIREVPKQMLKFFLHSYQSYLFNEILNRYIEKNNKAYFSPVPIIGYNTCLRKNRLRNIIISVMKEEGIKPEAFRIDELRLSCRGSKRKLFVKLRQIDYEAGKNLKLRFILPKGSYATILLREVCK
jgi:tRNA pseudouridine13 synthase